MARISLGKLSKSGYRMIFGEDYEDKNYLYMKSKIGRGYAALDGGMPSEFFSPLIPFETGFSFEAIFNKMKPLIAKDRKKGLLDGQTEEKGQTLSELANRFQLSVTTLTRVCHYLEEADYFFTRQAGRYNQADQAQLAAVIAWKGAHPKDNWKRAAQAVQNKETENINVREN